MLQQQQQQLKNFLGQSVVTHFTRVADIYIFHNYFIWFFILFDKKRNTTTTTTTATNAKYFYFFFSPSLALCVAHSIFTLRISSQCYGPLRRVNLSIFLAIKFGSRYNQFQHFFSASFVSSSPVVSLAAFFPILSVLRVVFCSVRFAAYMNYHVFSTKKRREREENRICYKFR